MLQAKIIFKDNFFKIFLIVLTVSFCTKVFNFMGISLVNSCNSQLFEQEYILYFLGRRTQGDDDVSG